MSEYTDGAVYTASCAAFSVLDHAGEYREISENVAARCDMLALGDGSLVANDIAAFVRKIGIERATPAVVAQQLKILKHWDTADTDPLEELIIRIFVRTLGDLDAFDQAEAKRLEALAAKPVEHPPMPIDETTLEPVDGPMETW